MNSIYISTFSLFSGLLVWTKEKVKIETEFTRVTDLKRHFQKYEKTQIRVAFTSLTSLTSLIQQQGSPSDSMWEYRMHALTQETQSFVLSKK